MQKSPAEDSELGRLLLDQVADKWSIRILQAFCPGTEPVRFNEIKRRVHGISQKTLSQCLRRLERNGILERKVIAAAPLGVEYRITNIGMSLADPLSALSSWAEQYARKIQEAQVCFDTRTQR